MTESVVRRRSPLLSSLLLAAVATLTVFGPSFLVPSVGCGVSTLRQARPATAGRSRVAARAFAKGDTVEAVFSEDGNWYSAVIDAVNKDGSYVVKWDNPDGGPETSVCKEDEIKVYVPPIPLDQLQMGQKFSGEVVSVAGFGAFVNIGAEKDGLVHISAVSDGFVDNIENFVQPGQKVDVWVKGVTDGKLSLVMVESKLSGGGRAPRAQTDLTPFQSLVGGDKVPGKVVSTTNFGAFVEISAGGGSAQGLVHISALSDEYVSDVNSVVSVGQEVEVYVKEVNMATGKMSLSMKSQ